MTKLSKSRPAFKFLDENQLIQIKSLLLNRLNEREYPDCAVGISDQFKQVSTLIEQTVVHNQSNSAILYGPRGTGKTMSVNLAMKSLPNSSQYSVVYLNGFIHNNDRLVVQAILNSLKIEEQDFSEDLGKSFQECFLELFTRLKSPECVNNPIIFILDEFDRFTAHNKQSLLYNLFDIVQSNGAPILVLGLTVRLDVLELLEKRVKSRFSHKQIYFWPANSFQQFQDIIKSVFNIDGIKTLSDEFKSKFYENVDIFFEAQQVKKIIQSIYNQDRNVRHVFKMLVPAVLQLDNESLLNENAILPAYLNQFGDSKSRLLRDLSILELTLLIAIKRLNQQDCCDVNFTIVYNHYYEFVSQHLVAKSKSVALKAFQNLMKYDLIKYQEGQIKAPKEFRMIRLLVDPIQIHDAVMKHTGLAFSIKSWACEVFN